MRGRFSLFVALFLVSTAALAMPQAMILVGSMLLSYGTALSVAGWAVGIGLVVAGTSWGAANQRRALQEQEAAARAAYNASLKDRIATVITADHPYVYVYGHEVVVGVRIVDVLTSGDRDQYHHLVCVVADHESDAILDVSINDKWLGALDASGNVTTGEFYDSTPNDAREDHTGTTLTLAHTPRAGSLRVTYTRNTRRDSTQDMNVAYTLVGNVVTVSDSRDYRCVYQWDLPNPRVRVIKRLGVAGTPADAVTMAECPSEYTSTCTMDGKTGLIIRLDLDRAEFQGGVPNIKVKMNGKKVHDVRAPAWPNDVPAVSSNNVLCIADYLTSEMCRVPVSDLPQADYIAAANACDALIDIGGQMLPRYTLNGTVRADEDRSQVLESMTLSMAGTLCSTTWRIHAGVWEAPVMALTQDDIRGDFNFNPGSSDADIYNGVKGQFVSAANLWVATDYKPYQNTAYVAADGGRELWSNIDMPFTDDVQRIHNIARILTEDHRNAFTIETYFSFKAWDVPYPGQRITFTSPFLGQTAKIYRVIDKKVGLKQAVYLKLKEDSATILDTADAVTSDSTPNTSLPNPYAIAPIMQITCNSGTDVLMQQSDGTVVPRILVEWPQATSQSVVHGGYIEIEWALNSSNVWNKVQVSGDATSVYLSPVMDGRYYTVRARCVGATFNVRSVWLYKDHYVVGKTAAPLNMTGLLVQSISALDVLNWDQSADLDVRVGGKILVRYSPLLAGATWETSTSACAPLPGASSSAVLPQRAGTYLIKAQDGYGLQSAAAVSVVSNGSSLFTYTSLGTVQEDPTFPGTFINTYHDTDVGSVIELVGAGLIDDAPDFDAISNFDYYGGVVPSGTYAFASGIDLGSTQRVRLTAKLSATAENVLDTIDDRTELIDDWLDFDGTSGAPVDAWVEVRCTADDPTASPTWGSWQRLDASDFNTRAFQFRAQLSSDDPAYNIAIDQLRITAEAI